MKYFRDRDGGIHAFEDDGSQDHLIDQAFELLGQREVSVHLMTNGPQNPYDGALSSIERWRSAEEAVEVVFEHQNRSWDAGLKSQSRIEPLLKLGVLPDGFFWTDHDNNDVPVTIGELREIGAAMNLAIVERGFSIHQRQREMKQQIESMTAEELIAFTPGWPG